MLHKSRSLEYRGLEISNNLARLPVATYFSLKPASTARCRAYPSAASPALLVLIFPGLCPATACLGSSEQFARKHRIYPAASRTGLYHPLKASPEIVHLLLRFTVHHKSDSRREFCIMAAVQHHKMLTVQLERRGHHAILGTRAGFAVACDRHHFEFLKIDT
jgi:hypothetical protein